MKILVVDDNKSNLYMLETLLKGSGYDVITAINGVEALEKIRQEKPEMIISDILMPKMDGFQLCREVKGDKNLKKIIFIFYTATYTDPKDEKFALSLGAEKFIVKPVDPRDFIKIIKNTIKESEEGVLVPIEKIQEEEPVYLREYTQRLVKKLEDKMLQMEEANKKLKESEERYRVSIESAPHGITVIDRNQKILIFNSQLEKITGYSKKEIPDIQTWLEKIYPDENYRKLVIEERKGIAIEERPRIREAVITRKDGEKRISQFVSCMISAGLRIVFISDITERKHLEQQKERSRREAEFYADVLGHDVGNINQITMGYLYLLQIAKDEETRKKNVDGIKRSIMKSKRLAESIKILKIIKDTKIEKFDLNKSIERSIKNIKEYSDKEIEVKLDIDKHYYVKANDFLDRVFFNILENSVEFIFKEKVIIDIKTEGKDGFCNVHIHDNGIGISKEKREDILENLETLSKRTGMGFYLMKKILERFNGKFEIKDVKKGTEIVVSIPVVGQNGGSARNIHPQRSHKRNERRDDEMRILIIDDEMDVLTLFKDVLETTGHKVEIAIDGQSGLEKFRNSKFDLIIMDYRMHGKDGIQASKNILNIDKNAKILFASADSSIKKEAIDMGAVGFLLKPFDLEDIINSVKKI